MKLKDSRKPVLLWLKRYTARSCSWSWVANSCSWSVQARSKNSLSHADSNPCPSERRHPLSRRCSPQWPTPSFRLRRQWWRRRLSRNRRSSSSKCSSCYNSKCNSSWRHLRVQVRGHFFKSQCPFIELIEIADVNWNSDHISTYWGYRLHMRGSTYI